MFRPRIAPNRERLLKSAGLTLALWAALSGAASALEAPDTGVPQGASGPVVRSARDESGAPREAPDLVVGSVRDESGAALAGAFVTLLDAAGREVGADFVDGRGTFAVRANGEPKSVRVRCVHCAPANLVLDGRTELTIVVRPTRSR
jgi:hypothetical protein